MAKHLTKQDMIKELQKCGKDPVYFLCNYARISHPHRGLIPFKMYPFQKDVVKDIQTNRFNIILKARQMGISWTVSGYLAWYLLFRQEKTALVACINKNKAANIVDKVKKIYKYLPTWMRIAKVVVDNKYSWGLDNGSKVLAEAASSDAGRSESVSMLVVDEAAMIDNLEEMWAAIYPTLSCVHGNTLVLTDKGFRRIEDLHEGYSQYSTPLDFTEKKLKVWSKNGLEEVSHGFKSPRSKTLKIKTRLGLELEVTPEHPLYKLDIERGKMVKSKQLKIGDHLRIGYGMNCFGDKELHPEDAYLLGAYIAEGWMQKNKGKCIGVSLCSGDEDFRNLFLNYWRKAFIQASYDPLILRCHSTELANFLIECGIDPSLRSYSKKTPKIIFESSKKVQKKYLQAMFDGDGCVQNDGLIVYSSTSLELIKETQLLLLNFGILSKIQKVNHSNEYLEKIKDQKIKPKHQAWKLIIPFGQAKKFNEEISFLITRKRDKLQKLLENSLQYDKTVSIPVFAIKDKIKKILNQTGKTMNWFRANDCELRNIFESRNKTITQYVFDKFTDLIQKYFPNIYDDNRNFFIEFSANTSTWDEIIEISESESETYDFTVPSTNSFLQNCILGSNTGGNCILLSSPKGTGGLFYKLWVDAEAARNSFNPIKLMWDLHPERDGEWFEKETKNMSSRQVAQEFLCDFNASGDTVIDPEIIKKIKEKCVPPEKREGIDKNLWIWKDRVPGAKYLMSVDVARGDGNDYSTFHMLDLATCEQVAEYQGKIPPDEFAPFVADIGNYYNTALVVVDYVGVGEGVATRLNKDCEYQNLYWSKQGYDGYIEHMQAENMDNTYPGFTITTKNRPLVIQKMEEYTRNNVVKINSVRLANEFNSFIWHNMKPQARRGDVDDLVMAYAVLCWVRDTALLAGERDERFQVALLNSFKTSSKMLNTAIPGMIGAPTHQRAKESFEYTDPAGNKQDASWLVKKKGPGIILG